MYEDNISEYLLPCSFNCNKNELDFECWWCAKTRKLSDMDEHNISEWFDWETNEQGFEFWYFDVERQENERYWWG